MHLCVFNLFICLWEKHFKSLENERILDHVHFWAAFVHIFHSYISIRFGLKLMEGLGARHFIKVVKVRIRGWEEHYVD